MPCAVACIGSRDLTAAKAAELENLGRLLAEAGYRINTGNATGADQAFARGANFIDPGLVTLYLPWPSYEQAAQTLGNTLVADLDVYYHHVAAAHHPNWKNLTAGVQRLMVRNAAIIVQSELVLALLNPHKLGGGGTGHGWRIAEALRRPRLELTSVTPEQALRWAEDMIAIRRATKL